MLTTRHPADFAYTRPELDALFRHAHEHDVERGGHYDARSAAINVWSHHWLHPATHAESEIIGSWYFHWHPVGSKNPNPSLFSRFWSRQCLLLALISLS